MSGLGEVGVALLVLVGIVGVLVPLLPGTLLVLAAGLLWTVQDGGGATRWTVFGVMAALLLLGLALKYVLPGKQLAGGLPRRTLVVGAAGAATGLVVLPPIGLLIGGVVGVLVAEQSRLHDTRAALAATAQVLRAVGLGLLVELVAAVLMATTWLVGVLVT